MALNDQSTQIRPGEELDVSLIDPYLKAHIPGLSGAPTISQFPGGASNLTYLIEYPEQEFVLRRPPFGHKAKSAHDMGREYRILNQLNAGFPYCPKAYVHCTDESVIGAEFYVMERVNGIILRSDIPAELNLDASRTEALCKSFIDRLVELHQVDYALKYCSRTIALRRGRIVYDGPSSALTPALLAELYGSEVSEFSETGAASFSLSPRVLFSNRNGF